MDQHFTIFSVKYSILNGLRINGEGDYCRFSPSSSTNEKHLKFGQSLDIDDRRLLRKFGEVMCLSPLFTARFVFYSLVSKGSIFEISI